MASSNRVDEIHNDEEQGEGLPNPSQPASSHNTRSRTAKANEKSPDAFFRSLSSQEKGFRKEKRTRSEMGRHRDTDADALYPREKIRSDSDITWNTLIDPEEVISRARSVQKKAERISITAEKLSDCNGKTLERNKKKYAETMIRFEDSRAEIDKLIHEGRRILFTVKRKQTFNTYIKRANDFTDEGAFYLNSAKEWIIRQEATIARYNQDRADRSGGSADEATKEKENDSNVSTTSQYFSEGLETVSATNGEDETHPNETQAAAVQEPNDGEEGGSEDNADDCRDLHQSWASEVDKESLFAEGERLRTDSPARQESSTSVHRNVTTRDTPDGASSLRDSNEYFA